LYDKNALKIICAAETILYTEPVVIERPYKPIDVPKKSIKAVIIR